MGRLPLLATPAERETVVAEALSSIYAPTTLASNDARWRTISRVMGKFGLDVFPPSVDKVIALGASLRAGVVHHGPIETTD